MLHVQILQIILKYKKNLQNIFPFLKPIVAFMKKMLNPYKYYKYEK